MLSTINIHRMEPISRITVEWHQLLRKTVYSIACFLKVVFQRSFLKIISRYSVGVMLFILRKKREK